MNRTKIGLININPIFAEEMGGGVQVDNSFNNPYGDFCNNGKGFKIKHRDIPRNWYNYMWNDDYIAFVSQVGIGEGMGQDNLGKRVKLVKSRKVYICDGDEIWSADALPVDKDIQHYECTHTLGSTKIVSQYGNTRTCFGMFVPQSGFTEVWTVKIQNLSREEKTYKVTAYAGTEIDGAYTYQGYNQGVADFDKELNALCIRTVNTFYQKTQPIYGYMASSEPISSYDTRHNTFIGVYDNELMPRALKRGKLENNSCHSEKACFALESTVTLAPDAEQSIVYICGFTTAKEQIAQEIQKYNSLQKADDELKRVKKHIEDIESNVVIDTPISDLNYLWNNWLKHATVMGSRWARVRHNGMRDLFQDCQCLSSFNPALAFANIKRVIKYQYSSGYVPRTVIDGEIRDKNFSDNAVWLAPAVYDIISEIGDINLLHEEVAFNDGTKASIYEHVKRSVDFLYNFRGLHNLIKIWGGDWNDCLNKAGIRGKGVSVWLSIAWCKANDAFIRLAEAVDDMDWAKLSKKRGAEMRRLINEYGWDGEYYLTAYSDDDIKIGTHTDTEGKIFLMPQLWSVLANVADDERKKIVYDSITRYLKKPIGTLISDTGFSECRDYLGDMPSKEPGAQENGGVYLQPICWKMIVDNIMKSPDEMEFDINTILPFKNQEVAGKGEPYILFNSYNSNPDNYRYSTPGQSWRTATNQWFVYAMIKYVFGICVNIEKIKLLPCIPRSWDRCSIKKTIRDVLYNIEYVGGGCEIDKMTIDGKEYDEEFLPYLKGKSYDVKVYMKK